MTMNLKPLEPLKLIPEPLVIETEGDSAWLCWDAAVRELDKNTPDGRAMALALMEIA
jgi:hypothetical protein